MVAGGLRSSGIEKPSPIQGSQCFGDYCNSFGSRLKSRRNRPITAPTGRNAPAPAPSCPFQLAFKSILLDRAESKLLGPAGVAFKESVQMDLENNIDDVRNSTANILTA